MKKIVILFLFLISTTSALAKESTSLTIFAESNMAYPLTAVARSYAAESNVVISMNFNSSYDLIQSIDDGEPADVFIATHPSWIETLKRKGLVDVYNLSNIAKDKLVLIASKKNSRIKDLMNKDSDIIQTLKFISNKRLPLIVDSENTSLGKYSDVILKKARIPAQKIYRKISEDKKSIVDFVNSNDEYCGIVMESSIKNYDNIVVLKEALDIEIYYQALVIAGDNMDKARDFLKFIKSDKAKEILRQGGFVLE